MPSTLDILIPTYRRPAALAVTLTSLVAQSSRGFSVIISDQTPEYSIVRAPEVQTVIHVLESHGHTVTTHRHLPARGMAEHRAFLLASASAPYVLFLDDDLVLEPFVVEQLQTAIRSYRCGFVGSAVIGLSHRDDIRPHEQHIEFWDGPPQPERIRPQSGDWNRHKLHNAANVLHVQQRLRCHWREARAYKVAWVGACVLYDRAKLESVGGFSFWRQLPRDHAGEDVLAQLRVMERYGGCAVLPSGVYHQELPTTIEDRRFNASQLFMEDASHEPQVSSAAPAVRAPAKPVVIEITPSELLTRISHVELAAESMTGPQREALNIRLAELRRTREKTLPQSERLTLLYEQLHHTNRRLLEIMHRLRQSERPTASTDTPLLSLGAAHFNLVDRLHTIRHEIDHYFGCELAEAQYVFGRVRTPEEAERRKIRSEIG